MLFAPLTYDRNMHKRPLAFTLIELMITVAIIVILTGLAAVSYGGIQQRGRDSQRKNDLSQTKIALSSYYSAQVPASYVSVPGLTTINGSTDPLSMALAPAYIKTMPTDPQNAVPYLYSYQSFNNAKNFKLYATLENKNDTKGWGGTSAWTTNGFIVQDE